MFYFLLGCFGFLLGLKTTLFFQAMFLVIVALFILLVFSDKNELYGWIMAGFIIAIIGPVIIGALVGDLYFYNNFYVPDPNGPTVHDFLGWFTKP